MSMEKIILITNGRPRSGKDTFATILNTHARVFKYSSIDMVKKIADACGWEGGKTEKDRKFLSDLKILTTEYSDMPFKDIKKQVDWFKQHNRNFSIMLIDIREPEEIERACKEFGAKSLFIENINADSITSNMADANVEKYDYDYIVKNNGTIDDFEKEIKEFYLNLIEGER